jgi:hypothetical protein
MIEPGYEVERYDLPYRVISSPLAHVGCLSWLERYVLARGFVLPRRGGGVP